MKLNELIAKAYDFLVELIQTIRLNKVKAIYLFGSVARGEASRESDIDIFIDGEVSEKPVRTALAKFLRKRGRNWELKGFPNEIRPIVGKLEEWELKDVITREGIVLYSHSISGARKYYLVHVRFKDRKSRERVLRKLWGRKERTVASKGILTEQGIKITPSVFLVPCDLWKEVARILYENKAIYRMWEVWL